MELVFVSLQVAALVGVAAVCSGLNVAFMSLNLADLKRKAKLGNHYAKRLIPLRKRTHLTLAAILLTNVAAASMTPLVIDSRLNGVLAVALSTLLLTVFSEIMPQALFARNAITITGRLSWLLRAMIFFTYPVSKPLQLVLDRLFGHYRSELHTRHELGLLVSEHLGAKESELDEDEVEIIRGALQLSEKKVGSIMTPIDKVFWLEPNSLIDEACIERIKASGHSRVPIFNRGQTICFGILLVRELVDDLTLYPVETVGAGTALDTMFRKFISSHAQLIPIEKDDRIVGIVTIEDLVEEIVGHEIEDETDVLKRKLRRK